MKKNLMWCFLCLLFALVANGCKTADLKENTDVSNTFSSEEEQELYASMIENVNSTIQQASSSWYQQLWTLNAQWQKSIYSSPDSTGRQYVQSVETLNSQSEGKNEKKDTVYVDFRYDAINETIMHLDKRLNSIETMLLKVSSEKKAGISWYQAALQFLGICAVLYFIVRLFIRKQP